MQNDILYNKVMKKILIIEIITETPEGESDQVSSVTSNMAPDEVMAPGNLPLICFFVLKDKDDSSTEIVLGYYYIKDDRSEVDVFVPNGPQVEADFANNVWILSEL